jgi:heme/copper-type cytochrome/quinol oxidase subunit 4
MKTTVVVILAYIEVTVHTARFLCVKVRDNTIYKERHFLFGHTFLLPVVIYNMYDTNVLHLTE